jgi:ribosomal protein L44E
VNAEDVGRYARACVDVNQVGEGPPVVDAVRRGDCRQHGIVEVEEPVAVAKSRELALPDRELKRPELGSRDVPLGQHPDERVDLVHAFIDRFQPRRERRSPDADDGVLACLVAMQRDDLALGVAQADEVEDARIVERQSARPRLTRHGGERRLRRQSVRGAQRVVQRHAVVATALDVDCAEVLHAREAARIDDGAYACCGVLGARLRNLEENAAERVVDLLVVLVLALRRETREHAPDAELVQQARVSERNVQRHRQFDFRAVPFDGNALAPELPQLLR